MKKLIVCFLILSGCSTGKLKPIDSCFLLYNMKTDKFEKVIGEKRCQERTEPCSTFKVPLALMSFDSKILRDENTTMLWDGKYRFLSEWNRDLSAGDWMKFSAVWYSQEVAKIMGKPTMQKYLTSFDYGNKDFSGSETTAWLPGDKKDSTIRISAYEQVEFMKKFWTGKLPVSKHATDVTKKMTYLETSKNGYVLSGKTGSKREKGEPRLGWFVAHLEGNGQEYIAVMTFNDRVETDDTAFGGPAAKEMMKVHLKKNGLWK